MTTTHPTLGEARLPRNPLLSEVLALVSKQKTKAKKKQKPDRTKAKQKRKQ